MTKYRVEGRPWRFGVGTVLFLTEAQAEVRAHALKPLGHDCYIVESGQVTFKAGEEIGLKDPPPKAAPLVVLADEAAESAPEGSGPAGEPVKGPEGDESADDQGEAKEPEADGAAEPTLEKLAEAAQQALDDGDVTAGGKPKVEAMERILGLAITAAQRDLGYKALNPEPEK